MSASTSLDMTVAPARRPRFCGTNALVRPPSLARRRIQRQTVALLTPSSQPHHECRFPNCPCQKDILNKWPQDRRSPRGFSTDRPGVVPSLSIAASRMPL